MKTKTTRIVRTHFGNRQLKCRPPGLGRALVWFLWLWVGLALNASADVLLSEGFERTWPAGRWAVGDFDPAGPTANWDKVDGAFGVGLTHSGSGKAYCAGFGYFGTTDAPRYQPSMRAYMRTDINLTGYTSATLTFWYMIPAIESLQDSLQVYVDSHLVFFKPIAVAGWTLVTVDLTPLVGASRTLSFEFLSNDSGQEEGAYVDDILVEATLGNDQCSGAIARTAGTPYTLHTGHATSTGDPTELCGDLGNGVWFTFTPSFSGVALVKTCPSDFNTVLAVYTGECGSLSLVQCLDDDGPACGGRPASVRFQATAGTTYRILAGGFGGASGRLVIEINVVPEPEIAVEQPPGTDLGDGTASVDFGCGLVGASSLRTFTIRNTGSANLAGLGISIDGPHAGDFTVTTLPATPVSPGGSTTFNVSFIPGAAGARMATLDIASNDGDETPFDIMLTGTGLTPFEIVQQAYLKASNTESVDAFGHSVAVSGDTLVIGASGEDSNATGVNGNENDNSASFSGAAYVFTVSVFGPRLTILRDGSGGYIIRCQGIPGWTYHLERASSVTGPWTTWPPQTAPPCGVVEFSDPSPPPSQTFYRTVSP